MITHGVKLQLDRERTLRYDYAALIALEEATGRSLFGDGLDMRDLMSARGLRDWLWAGLRHEDPELTRDAVAAMIPLDRLHEIVAAITEAFRLALPQGKDGGERPQGASG